MQIRDWLKLTAVAVVVVGYIWYSNINDSSEVKEWETDIAYHEGY